MWHGLILGLDPSRALPSCRDGCRVSCLFFYSSSDLCHWIGLDWIRIAKIANIPYFANVSNVANISPDFDESALYCIQNWPPNGPLLLVVVVLGSERIKVGSKNY